jgi:hypothetical protein
MEFFQIVDALGSLRSIQPYIGVSLEDLILKFRDVSMGMKRRLYERG